MVGICVFDAYGTLFDVTSAARAVAAEPGREAFASQWQALSQTWRDKQLQYTWLRAASGIHTDFWSVTCDGLDYALEAHGLAEPELRARLLALYRALAAYSEVAEMLNTLRTEGFKTAVLSNASPAMLEAAIASAGIADLLDAALSAEQVGVFKPAFANYALVPACFGCARREVLFVSSNGWDAWAAGAYGFRTAWVNRRGEPVERLPGRPEHILDDLRGIPDVARAL
ncbi:MAG: haloacid dehalogenase type II [Pseudomonadota bacterium]